MKLMSAVSTIWLNSVDPVARSQRCRDCVSRFQNWKT
jgi:hypothetical protein